ncbi:hypothetical protein GE061_005094 [Apolygus lucorum]|uniref:Uncharacterized protein n=1 Tax=Apolygus lucorum TaxID=248454 RepID=A0A8S9WX20_APOLU|nr:hypothetical protein GE061_005094 [Apolygus lucorum]
MDSAFGILERSFGGSITRKLTGAFLDVAQNSRCPLEVFTEFMGGLSNEEADELAKGIISLTRGAADIMRLPGARQQLSFFIKMTPTVIGSVSKFVENLGFGGVAPKSNPAPKTKAEDVVEQTETKNTNDVAVNDAADDIPDDIADVAGDLLMIGISLMGSLGSNLFTGITRGRSSPSGGLIRFHRPNSMEKCVFGIILSLSALSVFGNDIDSSDEVNPEVEDLRKPSDVFEKAVMERLRPELRERMGNFFRQEPGQVTDAEMRAIFESTFDPNEQKEVEKIFTEVVQEQMESIMGDMGFDGGLDMGGSGFGGGLDDFQDLSHFHDDHLHDHSEDDGYVFETEEDDTVNESATWGGKKKFVLEPPDDLGDDYQEKGMQSDDGEDEIINPAPPKDEF